ncbi:conserved hypothetical protein [Flavobacterium psychrophilum]|uniref:WbqC family protein n=1 Tax=Flavobacterium psychrophilum TaxID=96345 RepID=UPI000B7C1103|nr:WbqC family protein [Flavobacterium psychrophilum]GEJ36412.1 hypothetical protein FPN184_contig00049-0065 [Flavobacterium psychrophilum]GEJ48614.1 hypothetical protein FPKKA176_contig00012-0065 [Flavobacterium psychrophilum]SNB15891.1 conserved hypothetical protein [Flavobacterium psychrophilum]
MKKIAILQSNYIPWKGYFDLIASVDEFIIYDEMQYTKNDWRNRNKIKTKNGIEWITIPVKVTSISQKINETLIFDKKWFKKHQATLQTNYAKAKCFNETKDIIFGLYKQAQSKDKLSEINQIFIKGICDFLDIKTKISVSSDYNLIAGKTERLVDLCRQTNATNYLSGPSARDYIDESLFKEKNIILEWMNYSDYKEYKQPNLPFEHGVSILDLIFNEGKNARSFLKY